MQQHLYKFLVLHRRLNIPHVGDLVIEDEPSRLDQESGLLFAPKPVIRFHENGQQQPDKVFFHFLSEELVVDEVTAIREFHDYCYVFRNNIQEHRMASIAGIGRIVKRSEGDLFFTPENNLLELLPPVPWTITPEPKTKKTGKREKKIKPPDEKAPGVSIEETIEETEETVVSADRWWIYALLLLAAGGLALLFYYR